MATEANQTRKWRKWLLIALAISAAAPMCAIIVLQIIFSVHAIPKDQLKPPEKMLRIKPAGTSVRVTINPPDRKKMDSSQYLDSLERQYIELARAANRNPEAIRIYEKWQPFLNKFCSVTFTDQLGDWRIGQPLSSKQENWLLEHQDLIKDMLRMAKAGGFPSITCEQASALGDENLGNLNAFNYQLGRDINLIGILVAESCRMRTAGDAAGAAEILIAINSLAESIGEPFQGNQIAEIAIKRQALAVIEDWLGKSMPADIAQTLRENLAMQKPIDMRRGWELDYRTARYKAVNLLNSSFTELFGNQLSAIGRDDQGFREFFEYLRRDPMETLTYTLSAGFYSVGIKSQAESTLKDLDQFYGDIISHSAPGSDPESIISVASSMRKRSILVQESVPNLYEPILRVTDLQARTNLILAGLDKFCASQARRMDPFNHGVPLNIIEQDDATVIYSIGPDNKDDGASVSYDPTNGTNAGDILIRVPKK